MPQGMRYLTDSALQSHGSLRSSCCLIDSRWVLKVAAYGLNFLERDSGDDKGLQQQYRGDQNTRKQFDLTNVVLKQQ